MKRIILIFLLITSTNISFGQVNSISNTYRDNSTLIVQSVGGNNYNFIELSNSNEIKFKFTNPSCNRLLFTTENINGYSQFILYDILGNILKKERILIKEGELNMIEFNFINNGNYILKLTDNKKSYTQKLVYLCE